MKPLFIVVEALDGVGKTTLVRGLAERLGGVARNTPGDALRAVSSQVLGALGDDQTARCLFYAASVVAEGRRARRTVDEGGTVVMDRYWLSTVSYARARGVVQALDDVERCVPAPDVTVLVTLDEAERVRRMDGRGYTVADRETLAPAFRECVHREMNAVGRREALRPTVEVDVTGCDPEAALDRVLAAVRQSGATREVQSGNGLHDAGCIGIAAPRCTHDGAAEDVPPDL